MNRMHTAASWIIVGATFALAITGCSRIRLPAIDPNGGRIFLPPPNYTTLATPDNLQLGQGRCRLLPKPAFEGPPTPPPCGTGVGPPPPPGTVPPPPRHGLHGKHHQDKHNPGRAGTLQVTPSRLVAPVGGEVVLLAGVCGEDGYLIKKQPIEWILSQDSVGHFVEIGDDAVHHLAGLGREAAKKQSPVFATGRTASKPQLVTRGTPNPIDDVQLKKGQGWISLTSATEGTSHVTVLAPKTEGWEQRRQTATVHWIDAQWVLPPPVVERAGAGRTHRLVTTVSRTTGGSPAAGWKVRYEIVGGPPAVLLAGSGRGTSVTVVTDAAGHAVADLQTTSSEPGSSQVHIQIVRAGDASGYLAELPIGEGWTTVTWSAPGLKLDVRGPEAVEKGTTLTYQIDVSNHGDEPVRNAILRVQLPPGIELVSSTVPADRELGQTRSFTIGDLSPSTRRTIAITCRATQALGVDVIAKFDVTADDGLSSAKEVRTEILTPILSLTVSGPAAAEVGDQIRFDIQVTNQSRVVLSDVKLKVKFDPGLRQIDNLASGAENPLGDLSPGQSRQKSLSFVVEKAGLLCCQVDADAADGRRASPQRACVTASQPAQAADTKLQVSLRDLEGFAYAVVVENSGNREAPALRLSVTYPTTLVVESATDGFQQADTANVISWDLPGGLMPGRSESREIEFRPLGNDREAVLDMEVRSGAKILESRRFRVAIPDSAAPRGVQPNPPRTDEGAAGQAEPGPGSPPPKGPDAGGSTLSVSVTKATPGNVNVGDAIRFLIRVTNGAQGLDRNVSLRVELPEGLEFGGFNRPQQELRISPDGRTVDVEPARSLRAGESLDYTLAVRPRIRGRFAVQAEATSINNPAPVVRTVDVVVQ